MPNADPIDALSVDSISLNGSVEPVASFLDRLRGAIAKRTDALLSSIEEAHTALLEATRLGQTRWAVLREGRQESEERGEAFERAEAQMVFTGGSTGLAGS